MPRIPPASVGAPGHNVVSILAGRAHSNKPDLSGLGPHRLTCQDYEDKSQI
jgi:hypothetical protein